MREQHADLEEEHSQHPRQTASTISSQKAHITTLSHQVSLLESELGQFKQLAEERARAFEDLQAQFDELSTAQDSFTLQASQDEDWNVIREELHRQAHYMRQLEGANAKMTSELNVLREKQTSVEVLKEQKRDLERKLRGADELREKVVTLEAELDAARQEREDWCVLPSLSAPQTELTVVQGLFRPARHSVKDSRIRHREPLEPSTRARTFDGGARVQRRSAAAS